MIKQILNIVGWLGTALVVAAVVVRIGISQGRFAQNWDVYAKYGAWAGLACVVLYTLGQWREIVDYFRKRNARYGAIAGASVLVFLGILVAVNYLSFRQNKRWDLTKNQQYTLSDQTTKLLQNLNQPVKFLVFDKTENFDRFRGALDQYKYESPSKVDVEYIDIDKKPVEARQYQIQSYGTVVVEYQGRKELVTSAEEQDLTGGLVKALSPNKKKVYFLQGHGEKDIDSTERDGYGEVKTALGRDNYDVAKVVLAQEKDVPADASVVVVAGPRTDLFQPEADMLQRFLVKGGHVFVMVDPPDEKSPPTPVLDALLKDWDFQAEKDVVVDASGMGQLIGTDASVPVVAKYPPHPITDRFNVITAFPLARSITPILPASNGRAAVPIIQTSERSWAETDMNQLKSG
ncbi:MAG TPA: GldG family protein, partial [Vicinamibacterales bacterium]|nr:GldG family protein [Vicinamibacterales bacterium]